MTDLISTIHDPDGSLGKIARGNLKDLSVIKGLTIAATPATTAKTIKILKENLRAKVVTGGLVGQSRLSTLSAAPAKARYYLYVDFDKLLHWLMTDPDEFKTVKTGVYTADYIVLNRSPRAMKTYPKSWLANELPSNKYYSRLLGITNFDIHSGQLILSRKAADIILSNAKELGSGVFGEWAILCFKYGLSLTVCEVEGISWEDPDRLRLSYSGEQNEFPKWLKAKYDSPEEWAKRKEFAAETDRVARELLNNLS